MEEIIVERPEIVDDEHLEYLDDLRESGATNMYGAPAYLQRDFDLSREDAITTVSYWMKTFSQRRNVRTQEQTE